ncbi:MULTISPECIES: hypothetical protein [Amycolatopsis]|uniref:Ig-like domain-containing protein n=1 Tax=Amycolatopsis thermalba TaxID=944492 RepID=A0ABY4NWX7_9PSEU|nr:MULTISPECIES: hypothetical protein [Amycolatopsis]OXM72372.1 hypothetical protein CF166_14920 [Amycolatopsis sp. KNN50.9b]UQS24580.1 hypothetical protein L1857_18030 [Amycolatopsis thermalba]
MQHKRILAGAGLLAFAAGMLNTPAAGATAPPPKLSVSPSSVSAGEVLEFTAVCAGNASTVTSPGLAAPVTMTRTLDGYAGTGKAAAKPGSHAATFTCSGSGGPAGNGTATVTFTITGPTPTTTTKPRPDTPTATRTPAPSKTTPKAPQVKVLPKGAPETGDGTLAG